MSVTFGDITFDYVDYDPHWDTLVLRVGDSPRPGDDWDQSEELDPLVFEAGKLIGVDIMSARFRVERDGEIVITMPDGSVLRSPDVGGAIGSRRAA